MNELMLGTKCVALIVKITENEANAVNCIERAMRALCTDLSRMEFEEKTISGVEAPHLYQKRTRYFYVTEGSGELIIRDMIVAIRPGMLFTIYPNSVQTIIPDNYLHIIEAFKPFGDESERIELNEKSMLSPNVQELVGFYPGIIREEMARVYAIRTLNTEKVDLFPGLMTELSDLCDRLAVH